MLGAPYLFHSHRTRHAAGGFEKEEFAAEAFDIACLKAKGHIKARARQTLRSVLALASRVSAKLPHAPQAKINFPIEKYSELLPYLAGVSMEELVMAVRR